MLSVADIVNAVSSPYTVWRTLGGVQVEMCGGRPAYVVGNAAVSFCVWYHGERKMLKCYIRTNPNLEFIYGSAYLRQELSVIDIVGRHRWVDCLLMDYIEGRTLDEAICAATCELEYIALAKSFDKMACELLSSPRAHGDLKPENIIVRESGEMEAIDWDNAYVPSLKSVDSPEIGTAAYQHPERKASMFDKHVDDYSIAFISTMLHLMAVDGTVAEHYRQYHEPIYLPKELVNKHGWRATDALDSILNIFARAGMAREYRVAQMLSSSTPYLMDLKRVISIGRVLPGEDTSNASLEHDEHGWWGCVNDGGWIIPPLYSGGFEPSEGMILLELGDYRHFVAMNHGGVVASFMKESNVGPLRDGVTRIRMANGEERVITREELINCTKNSIFVR